MSIITYTYNIINVDPANKSMEIVYTTEGRPPVHMGARMPYVGEPLDSIVQMYAPIAYWEEQDRLVTQVPTGASGTISINTNLSTKKAIEPLEVEKERAIDRISKERYIQETSGISFNGYTISTDRVSQAMIVSAYTSLRDNIITSIDWKTDSGEYITVNLEIMTSIAQAVAQHVQRCFTIGKITQEAINAATTVEQINNINFIA